MSAAIAWIIPLPGNVRVAVGTLEFVHVLPDTPAKTPISDGPAFMKEALSWDRGVVPLFDAGKFSQGIEKVSDNTYYGIVRYRRDPSTPQQFGAMKMTAVPQRVTVDDQMACDLPDSLAAWRPFCLSCFDLDGVAVPVLDLARLFSHAPMASLMAAAAGAGFDVAQGANDPDPSGYTDSLAAT